MATETLYADGLITQTGLVGSISDINGVEDGVWLDWDDSTNQSILRTSFPTPTGNPTTGAGLQTFRLYLRKSGTGGGDPTIGVMELRETGGGTALQTITPSSTTITSTTGVAVTGDWDAANLGTVDGSAVELYITFDSGGGGPNERGIDVDSVRWDVEYTAPAQFIDPTGITSDEVFGSHTVSPGSATISPTGLTSDEAFGSHTVSPGSVTISPTGLTSDEIFGSHTVSLAYGDSILRFLIKASDGTTMISRGLASGSYVNDGVKHISMVNNEPQNGPWTKADWDGAYLEIYSDSSGGSSPWPTWYIDRINIDFKYLPTTADFIDPTGIASDEVFGTLSIQVGGVSVSPGSILTSEAFGTYNIAQQSFVDPTGLPSDEAFGTHVIDIPQLIETTGLISDEAFGNLDTVEGNRDVPVQSIPSDELFGAQTVSPGNVDVAPTGITTNEVVPNPFLNLVYFIDPVAIASAETFGTTELVLGGVIIDPVAIATNEAFGSHVVNLDGGGLQTLDPVAIASDESFGAHVLSGFYDIDPTGITTDEAFGSASLALGTVTVFPTALTSDETFGSHTLVQGQTIEATGLPSGETFGLHTMTVGGVNIGVTGIVSAETFGGHTLDANYVLQPSGATTDEAFGSPTLSPGGVLVDVVAIPSGEVIGSVLVSGASGLTNDENPSVVYLAVQVGNF